MVLEYVAAKANGTRFHSAGVSFALNASQHTPH